MQELWMGAREGAFPSPRRLAWMLVALVAIGCEDASTSGGAAGGGGATSGGPRDALAAAWKQAGLQPSAMTAATVPVGKDCHSGTVNNVDVLVCVFATPADAKAAEAAGLTWVGDTTGAAQARGALLIAVADRRKADPSGRTINQLMKAAPK